MIVASRILGPTEFGVQASLAPFITVALLAIDLGVSRAIVQTSTTLAPSLVKRIVQIKALTALLISLLLVACGASLGRLMSVPDEYTTLFQFCGAAALVQSLRAHEAAFKQRSIQWRFLAHVEMVEIAIYNVLLVVLALLLHSPWCFLLAAAARYGLGAVMIRGRKEQNAGAMGTTSLSSLLRFGIPLQMITIFGMLNALAVPAIVGRYLGIDAVGIVGWSSSIALVAVLPFQPLPEFLFSVFAAQNRNGKSSASLTRLVALMVSILSACASVAVAFAVPVMVSKTLGDDWLRAIPVVALLVSLGPINVSMLVAVSKLTADGFANLWLAANAAGTILVWALCLFFVPRFGLIGYCIAMVLATTVPFTMVIWFCKRCCGLSLSLADPLMLSGAIVGSVAIGQIAYRSLVESCSLAFTFSSALMASCFLSFLAIFGYWRRAELHEAMRLMEYFGATWLRRILPVAR